MSSSGSCSWMFSRWRSPLCSDLQTLWLVAADSILTLLISVLQVSWQRRQGQTLPRERLVPIGHHPSSPSGAASATATAADDQSSATKSEALARPASCLEWLVEVLLSGKKVTPFDFQEIWIAVDYDELLDWFLLFGTKLCFIFTDQRWTEPTMRRFRGAETFQNPPFTTISM